MVKCKCINKYREEDGSIFQYLLEDENHNKKLFEPVELKMLIKSKQLFVVNLTLTKDNRLIDKKYDNFKVTRQGDKRMETYKDLFRRIRRQDSSAKQQLEDRINNIIYLAISDDKGKYLGFIMTEEIQKMLENIDKLYSAITIKESQSEICNEVYYTCSIEGAKTTIKRTEQIMKGSKPEDYSEKMVYNSYQAVKYLNIVRQNSFIDEKTLLKVWSILTKDVCDNIEIKGNKYRSGEVMVGTHTAPEHNLVEDMMKQYFDFMTKCDMNPYIKVAVLHFYLVFIHPFCDGNGRLTRLVSTDYLIRSGLDKFKAISLSKEIKETVLNYQQALENSENDYNDITFFIEYYLNTIQNVLEDIVYSK